MNRTGRKGKVRQIRDRKRSQYLKHCKYEAVDLAGMFKKQKIKRKEKMFGVL